MADLGGREGRMPPLGTQILSISCSFWENLAKSYVGAPPGEILDPPLISENSAVKFQESVCWEVWVKKSPITTTTNWHFMAAKVSFKTHHFQKSQLSMKSLKVSVKVMWPLFQPIRALEILKLYETPWDLLKKIFHLKSKAL